MKDSLPDQALAAAKNALPDIKLPELPKLPKLPF